MISLAQHNIMADWDQAANHLKAAMLRFATLYEERLNQDVDAD